LNVRLSRLGPKPRDDQRAFSVFKYLLPERLT